MSCWLDIKSLEDLWRPQAEVLFRTNLLNSLKGGSNHLTPLNGPPIRSTWSLQQDKDPNLRSDLQGWLRLQLFVSWETLSNNQFPKAQVFCKHETLDFWDLHSSTLPQANCQYQSSPNYFRCCQKHKLNWSNIAPFSADIAYLLGLWSS